MKNNIKNNISMRFNQIQLITLITLLITSLITQSQEVFKQNLISENTSEIVRRIAETNIFYEDESARKLSHYTEIQKSATSTELNVLFGHPNGAVRSNAFQALSEKPSTDLMTILSNYMDDDELVDTGNGCFGKSLKKVGDIYISSAMSKLDSTQKDTLKKLLVNVPNSLFAQKTALYTIKPKKTFYPRIKELVVEEKNSSALVALAKYRKDEDVDLIIDFLEDNNDKSNERKSIEIYRAVREYPHPDFFPILKDHVIEELNSHGSNSTDRTISSLYYAIASYKNNESLDLLYMPITKKNYEDREIHIEEAYYAIQEFKNTIYDELFWLRFN